MTPNQAKYLEFIKDFIGEKGYSPTIGEISKAMGLASRTGSAGIVEKLETDGHIIRRGNGARNIEIKSTIKNGLSIAAERLVAGKYGEVIHAGKDAVLVNARDFEALKRLI